MSKITYRGCSIETDTDECGSKVVYVYLNDGGDPLEIIGADIDRAKNVIDECLRDLDEANGYGHDDEFSYPANSDRERFGADY